jgi:arylsulfatase A-like enzyme
VLFTACEPPAPAVVITARLRALGQPSVVLIVVDALRADWTAPYGGRPDASPELDRWARHGALFERVLAQSSWTKVSMASLMTSLWPRRHGVRETTDGLAEGARTVGELFREAGYRTYAVQSNGWLEQTFGFHQGFDRYLFPRGGTAPGLKPMIWPHADNVYREAARLIEAHDRDRPFFLYLHFMDVHEYAAPSDFKRFGTSSEGAYLAAIAWVDEVVERLRGKLDDAGLLERTILVLASDHGEAFGENGVQGHARNVLTPVLHVPLVIRFPFRIEPIRVVSQVRNLDIAPTLLDLAGLRPPASFEGRSLLPLLEQPAGASDLPSYASLTTLLYRDAMLQESVTDGLWTFARNTDASGKEFLFDRSVDPGENVSLVEIEKTRAQRMRSLLDGYLALEPETATVEPDVRIDPALAQKLRALGYLR